jgi:hypothetical protein
MSDFKNLYGSYPAPFVTKSTETGYQHRPRARSGPLQDNIFLIRDGYAGMEPNTIVGRAAGRHNACDPPRSADVGQPQWSVPPYASTATLAAGAPTNTLYPVYGSAAANTGTTDADGGLTRRPNRFLHAPYAQDSLETFMGGLTGSRVREVWRWCGFELRV